MNSYDQGAEVYSKLASAESKLAALRELVHNFSPAYYKPDVSGNIFVPCGPWEDPKWTPAQPVDELLERLIAAF